MISMETEIQGFKLFAGLLLLIIVSVFVVSVYRSKEAQKELESRLSKAGIHDIDSMKGIEFEHYLEVLFSKMGYKVTRTPSSNDYGADLILDGEYRIVVQAKRYKNKVGVKAVQEIHSARGYYKAQEAWVITNSYFSAQAANLAEVSNVVLIDREALVDIIIKNSNS